MAEIHPIVMPKWGLAMQEGMLAAWHVAEGATVTKGQEIADIETSKIANAFESPVAGLLRRRIASEGEVLPVGALLGVVADAAVPDAELDVFVADFRARMAAQDAAASSARGPEPQTVEAGGRRLRYLAMGDAPGDPIVLVHGFGGDLNGWLFNQPVLAERRTTYALDLPGHGGSSKEVGAGDVTAMAAAVRDLLDALAVGRAHLVGHSMGGAAALRLALDGPDRVAGLTLVCPAGLGAEVDMEFIEGFISAGRARKLRPILETLVADPKLVTGDMVEEVLRYKRLDGAETALRRMAVALFPGGRQALVMRDRLGELRVPARVVWGAEDRIVPARHAEGLPGAVRVSVLPGAGHLVHMERAGEVNALILDDLAR